MQLLLAILLYLNVIISPGTYSEEQINLLLEQHSNRVDAAKSDKATLDFIKEHYGPKADGIIIIQSETD